MQILKPILLLLCISPFTLFSQRVDIDVFGGISNYQGDLQPAIVTLQNAQPAAAVIAKIGFTDNIFLRAGFSFGSLHGTDAKNKGKLILRNLSFRSGLQEFHAGVEVRLFKPETFRLTPYGFIGVGFMRFNPYTSYEVNGEMQRVYLQPLGTEGQGLDMYPERKPYSLSQLCIPYGGGIKYEINCNLNVGVELRQTKVFTDYLDDVSSTYANYDALRNARGQLAVDVAYRRDEIDGTPYPNREDATRGDPEFDDWYYFVGVTIGLRINNCETGAFSLGGLMELFGGGGGGYYRPASGSRRSKNMLKCPKF